MPRSKYRIAGWVAVAWLLVASCTSGHAPPQPDKRSTPATSVTGPQDLRIGKGTIWLLAGPNASSANVFRVDGPTGQVTQITRNKEGYGVSWVSASTAGVVIADASTGVDRISTVTDGQVTPMGTGDETTTRSYTPAISPDGQLAYARAVYPPTTTPPTSTTTSGSAVPRPSAVEPSWELVVDTPTAPETVIARGSVPLAAPTWGPDGALAYLKAPFAQSSDIHTSIVITDQTHQPVAEYPTPIPRPSGLIWSVDKDTPLAVTDGAGATALFDPLSKAQSPVTGGWNALCWNPQDRQLLLAKGSQLGLVNISNTQDTMEIGPFSHGNIFGCGWIDQ